MMLSREAGFYKAFWLAHNRIVFVELIGYFYPDLLNESYEHIKRIYIEPGENPVHVVIDIKGLTRYPRQFEVVEAVYDTPPPTAGWIILVGFDNPLTTYISRMAPQVFNMGLKCADTLYEAFSVLRELDTTLTEAH